jgi:hypothetical protein
MTNTPSMGEMGEMGAWLFVGEGCGFHKQYASIATCAAER